MDGTIGVISTVGRNLKKDLSSLPADRDDISNVVRNLEIYQPKWQRFLVAGSSTCEMIPACKKLTHQAIFFILRECSGSNVKQQR